MAWDSRSLVTSQRGKKNRYWGCDVGGGHSTAQRGINTG
jgi:hypothetical protein